MTRYSEEAEMIATAVRGVMRSDAVVEAIENTLKRIESRRFLQATPDVTAALERGGMAQADMRFEPHPFAPRRWLLSHRDSPSLLPPLGGLPTTPPEPPA